MVCESGCVEMRLAKDYEEQFSYEHEIIHVRQVNSVNDIPRRVGGRSRGPIQAMPSTNNEVSSAPPYLSLEAASLFSSLLTL